MTDLSDPVAGDVAYHLVKCGRCGHTRRRHHPGARHNASQHSIYHACAACSCGSFRDATDTRPAQKRIPTHGRTGAIIDKLDELDRLPAGTVVVPLWMADRVQTGQTACVRYSDGWFTTSVQSPVHPLGTGPDDHRHGVRVVYDPRDEL
ncbi:hypothetical protein SEA_VERITY_73 [Gordonia phage Verity]|uniref:Uncharacterized protein n=1 Tax=Gordonia phage Verity TaxID=2591211 RepID=A0A514DIV6_9CAUD|nr:hypothetical protein J1776_gp73 [Gordonia phage Verity]QDH93559.1 hypothetical protein SEA_VERITY_73 [Gordonia phage Verity]QPO16916.1 hypothetical protein SEA_DELREY21_73 [Gordonia phage Delrey21]QXN74199.1 hypothetical protein SEA_DOCTORFROGGO_73 [Gordonia phage DoctorFroggo]